MRHDSAPAIRPRNLLLYTGSSRSRCPRDVAWMLVQVKGVDFDEGGNEWVMGDSLELQVGATKDKNGRDALRSKPVSYSSSKRTQWSCSWSKCRA